MRDQQSPDSDRLDELYSLLANRHRRAVLAYFRESSSEVASLHELVDEIADPDHGGEEQAVVQLHHYALPRLDAADVVDYDARSNAIRYHGHPDLEHLELPFDER